MILYIDDQEMLTRASRELLSDAGYVVAFARTVEEALDVVESKGSEIDLVLLDVMMPRHQRLLPDPMDILGKDTGFALIGKIRELLPNIEVWLVTVRHTITPEQLSKAGIPTSQYYKKPVLPTQLLREVETFFHQRT